MKQTTIEQHWSVSGSHIMLWDDFEVVNRHIADQNKDNENALYDLKGLPLWEYRVESFDEEKTGRYSAKRKLKIFHPDNTVVVTTCSFSRNKKSFKSAQIIE